MARLLSVEPCPPIESGIGRVVTATFTHLNGHVLRLRFEGANDVLKPTRRHPFWSMDRNAWIDACDLSLGERVLTTKGPRKLLAIGRELGVFRVFNIEVEGAHTYCVATAPTTQGVWVHNGCDDLIAEAQEQVARLDPSVSPTRAISRGGEITESSPLTPRTTALRDQAQELATQLEAPFKRSGPLDGGVPGNHAARHAEITQFVENPNTPIGISNPEGMCGSCAQKFTEFAAEVGETQVVGFPGGTSVFPPGKPPYSVPSPR